MENLPTLNLPLLREVIDWAEAEAAKTEGFREWNQDAWMMNTECGTTYCIAGYVVAQSPLFEPTTVKDRQSSWAELRRTDTGQRVPWSTAAAELLGLTRDDADDLFEADNSIEDVRRIAEEIAEDAGERL
jgi:hypothetical protein